MRIPARQTSLSLLLATVTCGNGVPAQERIHKPGHSLELVPLFAVGPGAEHLTGSLSNAAVGQVLLARAAGDSGSGQNPSKTD